VKALSVQQPWAGLIVTGIKAVENRTWATTYRGPLWIHAGKRYDEAAVDLLPKSFAGPLPRACAVRGAVIGAVVLTDVRQDLSENEWAQLETWHWYLSDPYVLSEPFKFKGRLRIFTIEGFDKWYDPRA